MGQERMEILRMVAEKKISVEDAERLLRAIEDGDRSRQESGAAKAGQRGFRFGELLGDVGSMVQGVVEEAASGIGAVLGDEEPGGEDVPAVGGRFEVASGARLVIRQRRWKGRGDLELAGVAGSACELVGAVGGVRTFGEQKKLVVTPGEGALRVAVPASVAELKAVTMGGKLRAEGLGCPVELKSMGGDVSLSGARLPFEVKSMGGAVQIEVALGLTGESRAETMGGDLRIDLPAGINLRIEASTWGGAIEVDPEIGVGQKRDRWSGKAVLELAAHDPATAATLRLKSTGGRIELRRKAG
jgi:hypothetical protein